MTAAGAFQYATMAGIAAGALLLGFLADRIGRKRTIILGLCSMAPRRSCSRSASRFGAFVVLLAVSGLGISVFKIGALALIGDVSASTTSHTRFMNTIEGFFAVGAIVGTGHRRDVDRARAVLEVALRRRRRDLRVARGDRGARALSGDERAAERATLRQMVSVLRDPLALGVSALVMLYVAVEVAIYVWMPTYLTSYGGSFAWLPAYALTLFFVLRAAGRFLGAWLLERVPWTAALVIVGTAIFLCFLGSLSLASTLPRGYCLFPGSSCPSCTRR